MKTSPSERTAAINYRHFKATRWGEIQNLQIVRDSLGATVLRSREVHPYPDFRLRCGDVEDPGKWAGEVRRFWRTLEDLSAKIFLSERSRAKSGLCLAKSPWRTSGAQVV